jgi:UDP-N-acetyl-D-mannosaminuronic acid dehydrogenase
MVYTTVSIVGMGYIGLPTAALLASRNLQVIGVDINEDVVNAINTGKMHFVEPDLDELLQEVVRDRRLRATTRPEPADAFLIAAPTPLTEDRKAELSHIEAAAESIAPVLTRGNLLILESTVPVGTTEKLAERLAAARPDLRFPQQAGEAADIHIAYCPERVLPGRMLHELVSNDRVIGGMSNKASAMATSLYQSFVTGDIVIANARTAELCKLAENSFRDVNIAFANELSMICDRFSINVWELIQLANRHPRVNILRPGPGVGGHCVAVDPWFIVDNAPEEARLIKTAREVNDYKSQWVLEKIKTAIFDALAANPHMNMADITVACLGLAYKPNIDDLRESPAVSITQSVAQLGCRVLAVEPHLNALPALLQMDTIRLALFEEALDNAQVLCILAGHSAFVRFAPDLNRHGRVVDAVGLLSNTAAECRIPQNDAMEQNILRLEMQLNHAKYENHLLLDRLHKMQERDGAERGWKKSSTLRYGAADHVRQLPAYRFGEILVNKSQSFIGCLSMPLALLKEYRAHRKEKKQRGNVPLPVLTDFADAHEGSILCQTVTFKLGKEFIANITSPSTWFRLPRTLRKTLRETGPRHS